MNKLCALFGHEVSPIALLICEIKANDLNRGKTNIMKCERCDWTLDLNNVKDMEQAIKDIENQSFFKSLWKLITFKKSI